MSEIDTTKAVVKTVASKDLQEQVEKELKIEDPELDKAKAILGLDVAEPSEATK